MPRDLKVWLQSTEKILELWQYDKYSIEGGTG